MVPIHEARQLEHLVDGCTECRRENLVVEIQSMLLNTKLVLYV